MTSYDVSPNRIPGSARASEAGAGAVISSEIERFQYRLHSTSWVYYLFALVIVGSYFGALTVEDWLCAVIVEIAAFYSVFLWARRRVLGIPIMPAFSVICLVYYGLPFVTGHPATLEYDSSEKFFAASTVATVLLIMTVVWARIARPAPPRPWVIKALRAEDGAIKILMGCLVVAILFQSNLLFLIAAPPSEVVGIMRAVLLTLGLLAMFTLSYLMGAGVLTNAQKYLFILLAAIFIAYHAVSLYLITATQYVMAVAFGFFLGRGKLPWKLLILILVVLMILQAGKSETRQKYAESGYSELTAFALIQDWLSTGVVILFRPSPIADEDPIPLAQRTSLIQMLLKTQTEAPTIVPYLYGSTYYPIPFLLVPRIVWPDRPNTSETLVQLNVHYGLLTRESSESTSIGWGIIAESNANFGLWGCLGLAVVMGALLGVVQQSCGRFPLLSARGMGGLLMLSALLGMEASMAQFLTILLQSLFPLILLTFTVMRPTRIVV